MSVDLEVEWLECSLNGEKVFKNWKKGVGENGKSISKVQKVWLSLLSVIGVECLINAIVYK